MSVSQLSQQRRVNRVIDALLYELQKAGFQGVYVEELGWLVVSFEAEYYQRYGEPYIGFSEKSLQPSCVIDGLEYALDKYRNSWTGATDDSPKIGTGNSGDIGFEYTDTLQAVLQKASGRDGELLQQAIKNSKEDLYWLK